jgi:hypothetical protein
MYYMIQTVSLKGHGRTRVFFDMCKALEVFALAAGSKGVRLVRLEDEQGTFKRWERS